MSELTPPPAGKPYRIIVGLVVVGYYTMAKQAVKVIERMPSEERRHRRIEVYVGVAWRLWGETA